MRIYRLFILMCTFLVIFTLLLGKIFYYQIIRGEEIAKQATAMRSKQITLKEYSRGQILDRNQLPLTDNHYSSALYCLPYEIARAYPRDKTTSSEHVFSNFATILAKQVNNIDPEVLATNLNNAMKKGSPIVRVATNLDSGDINNVNSSNLVGVVIAPIINRYEPSGFCSHIIGYVSGNEEVQGVAGIEKQYDQILNSSTLSPQLVSVNDARGRAIQGLMFKIRSDQSNNQGSVVLTIDKRIQKIVEQAIDKRVNKGVVVVMDTRTKEILAIASRPAFNPNDLPSVISNNDSPLTNRALSRYYPGSLFKIFVAAAALEENIVSLEDTFRCDGAYKFTDKLAISCWKEGGHGSLSFIKAFANSCNPAFIEVGLNLKRDKFKEYADKFHLTDETINGWLEKGTSRTYININPGPAGIGNACLGQQGIMLTPVQITNLIATIANDGKWGIPSIAKYVVDQKGNTHHIPEASLEQVISVSTARQVQMLMEEVVTNGTGKNASISTIKVAGKTATSQTGGYDANNQQEILNTWFGGYFPADQPKWAVVVMVEEGSSGAVDAAPIFKNITSGILELFSTVN